MLSRTSHELHCIHIDCVASLLVTLPGIEPDELADQLFPACSTTRDTRSRISRSLSHISRCYRYPAGIARERDVHFRRQVLQPCEMYNCVCRVECTLNECVLPLSAKPTIEVPKITRSLLTEPSFQISSLYFVLGDTKLKNTNTKNVKSFSLSNCKYVQPTCRVGK